MLYKRCGCADGAPCSHPFWFQFELNGQRYRKSTKTSDRRKAERAETRARNEVLDGKLQPAAPKPTKLSTHIDNYLAHTAKTNKTAYKDAAVLDRLLAIVGLAKHVADVKSFDIERWKSSRAEDVEQSTVNRELNIVRGCFSRAVDWGLIATSPATAVKDYRVDNTRIRVLSDDELRRVLAIEDPFVVLVCRATLESLARISALLSLHASHVGPTWVEMLIKGGVVHRVPVTPELRTALLARAHPVSGMLFGEGATGIPPTQQTASNRVLRALAGAGVPDASHHTMRHTGVTLMLDNGVNPRVIQVLAGWSSLRMLERYGHARDAETVRAVRGIAQYLTDATTEQSVSSIDVATKTHTQN